MSEDIKNQVSNLQTYVIISCVTMAATLIIQLWKHVKKSKCTAGTCCNVEIENEDEDKQAVKHVESALNILKRRPSRDATTTQSVSIHE